MRKDLIWVLLGLAGGWLLIALLFVLLSGALDRITAPDDSANSAYKVNPVTSLVWLVNTYTRQLGELHVLAAREAAVDETMPVADTDAPAVAMKQSASQRAVR